MSTAPTGAAGSPGYRAGLGWPDPEPATSTGLGWPADPTRTADQPAQETS
jgi:hypothetical protein